MRQRDPKSPTSLLISILSVKAEMRPWSEGGGEDRRGKGYDAQPWRESKRIFEPLHANSERRSDECAVSRRPRAGVQTSIGRRSCRRETAVVGPQCQGGSSFRQISGSVVRARAARDSCRVESRCRATRSRPKSCSAASALCAAQRSVKFDAMFSPPCEKGLR
jgi:hypothetical protein